MPKGDLLYLGHMLDVSLQAVAKVQGKSREDFGEDENLRLTLAHLIQVIGEAARRAAGGRLQIFPDFSRWLGMAKQAPENPNPRFRTDDDLWQR